MVSGTLVKLLRKGRRAGKEEGVVVKMSDAMDLKRRAKLLRELAELPCISEEAKRRAELLRRIAEVYERDGEAK